MTPAPSRAGTAALATLFAVVVAQAATAAALPATSRLLGLADWQAGVVTSASAAVVVLTSPWWGRRADAAGPRPVLLAAALAGTLGTLGVAAVLAVTGTLPPTLGWVALLVARGLVFGTAVAAAGPATQVRLVADSASERERVGWIARAGAVRGLGTMAGAGLAAALGAAGAAVPVVAAAAAVVGAGLWVAARRGDRGVAVGPGDRADDGPDDGADDGPAPLGTSTRVATPPPAPAPAEPATAAPTAGPGAASWRGAARLRGGLARPAVRAAVTASAGVFLAMALVQGSIGFLVQDRYGLAASRATALTGTLLLVAGLGSMLSQGLLVPRLGWRPWRLVRAGGAVLVAALGVYVVPLPVPALVAVALVFGAGVGAAAAGCTSAASTAVGPREQGDVAGLVNAANALTFVVGPTLAAAAHGRHPALPAALALAAGLLALLAARGRR